MRFLTSMLLAVSVLSLTGCPQWFSDSTPPGDVLYLEGNGENGSVILKWTLPQDNDIDTVSITYGSENITLEGDYESVTVENLEDGTEYKFTVRVIDTSGNSSPGVSIYITPNDTLPAEEVTDLAAIPQHESVKLTWTDPDDNDLDHIEITWSPGDGTILEINQGLENYIVTGLEVGTEYTFTISTLDNSDNVSSGKDISATPIDSQPPAEITGIEASVRSRKIIFKWSDPVDEDFDYVKINWNPDGDNDQTADSGLESYTAAGLSNGTQYTFILKTVDTYGNVSTGESITATPQPTYILSGSWQSNDSGDTFTPLQSESDGENPPFLEMDRKEFSSEVTDQIIIRYNKDTQITRSLSERIERYGKETIKVKNPDFRLSVIQLKSKTAGIQEVLEYYNSLPEVEYAEPDYLMHAFNSVNDLYYSYQWNFVQLQMPNVWNQVTGDSSVTVAVVDSGIAYNLSDLSETTILTGWDFVNNDSNPYDDNMHGTHIAGTIAQSTNNEEGTAGMAYGVSLLPVKVLAQNGSGYTSDIAAGIIWAADEGADIINLSLGGPEYSQTLYDACRDAYNSGAALFAASGNDNGSVLYPAAIDEYVIAVGATDYEKNRAPYSNYGSELDIVAPGGDLTKDINNDSYSDGILQQTITGFNGSVTDYTPIYVFLQGTSMACPHVSALAALIKSKYPDATNSALYETILSTADDLGISGWDTYYGYGLINPMAALNVGIQIYTVEQTETVHYTDGSSVQDEWIIQAGSGTIEANIQFNNIDGNLDLFLYDPQGNLIQSSEGFSDRENISYYVGSQGGTYTIKVKGSE
ncbi:MAG: S8 family serine peptidase [Spirochaetia bacterium]